MEYKFAAQELYGGKNNSFIFNYGFPLANDIQANSLVTERMKTMYENTQNYLSSIKKQNIKLYRGVGQEVITHGPIESWSASKVSAKSFDGHGVLERTIPKENVLFTYETLKGWPEERVKGKKEYGVLGGLLDK